MNDVLRDAARVVPLEPGIYVFLGASGEVLYVGKAGNLRRRLQQHAKVDAPTSFLHGRYERVRDVRWELATDEEAAAWREADLIFALRPPFNAETRPLPVERHEPGAAFVVVRKGSRGGALRFTLDADSTVDASLFGCFPHLGKGQATRLGIACSDGYVAFLRLLWAAGGEGDQVPRVLTRSAPDSAEVSMRPEYRRSLGSFLRGVSPRLVDALAADAADGRPAYMQPALTRDRAAALLFFRAGPRALRSRRLRHGLPSRPVDADTYRALVLAELHDSIGPFNTPAA